MSSQPPETVTLFSDSLLCKWGFEDGDLLDWLSDFGNYDSHIVLCTLVRQKLIPLLEQKVEVREMRTIHNPIRVYTVDGKDVSLMHRDGFFEGKLLTPASITVTGAEVLEIANATLGITDYCTEAKP